MFNPKLRAYFFLDSFSFTLNFTIFFTKSNGIGLPNGNWIVPLLVLRGDNFSESFDC